MSEPSMEGEQPGIWRRFVVPALFLAFLFGALFARRPAPQPEVLEITGATMGTTYRILVVESGLDSSGQQALGQAIGETLREVNQSMSTYMPDSEISRFNDHSSLEPVAISSGFHEVLSMSLEIHSRSRGAFDVTVGPLVNLWGFGAKEAPAEVDDALVEETLARVGSGRIVLSETQVAKLSEDLEVDVSAIAKGWGVDQIAELLRGGNHSDFLVEIGGEIRAAGLNPEGQPWRLGIEKPLVGEREVQQVVGLENQAMATSGDYRNFIGEGAQRRSHSIDPRTGRPVTHSLASVSVIAADCASADAWATALTVLGPDEGLEVAEEEGLSAFFLIRQEDGSFLEKTTTAFGRLKVP